MNEQAKKSSGFVKGILKAVIFGIILFSVLTLFVSAIFYLFTVKEDIIPVAFKIILFTSVFVTGIFSSKNASSKGFLRGIASGVIFICFILLLFSFFKKATDGRDLITYIIMLLLSFFGGILGINSQW